MFVISKKNTKPYRVWIKNLEKIYGLSLWIFILCDFHLCRRVSTMLFPYESSLKSLIPSCLEIFFWITVYTSIGTPTKRPITERPVIGVSPIVFAEDSKKAALERFSHNPHPYWRLWESFYGDLGIMRFSLNNGKEASLLVYLYYFHPIYELCRRL